VEAAGSFDDVARVLSDGRADIALVVADVTLPGPDGLHVVDRLRSRDAALRVLLTSGLAGESPALATVRARGLALLRKPFTPRDLVRAVRHELDAPG
jgi:DNA-binding response OmpR family regulator